MTDIVERLRDNVKWLERDGFLTNARNTEEAADEIERMRAELAESQAREAKLREVLKTANTYMQKAYECLNRKELAPEVCGPNGGYIYSAAERVEWAKNVAREALALPHDDSALKERLNQERERVADYVYTHSSYIDDDGEQVTFAGHAMLAAAIRAMGDE